MISRHQVAHSPRSKRRSERLAINVAGRLTWRDARGVERFATVVTKDVSQDGVYLECRDAEPIPLYRLVYLQIERPERESGKLPLALRDTKVLSAVYRVGPCASATGAPTGYALRLLVDPSVAEMAALRAVRSIA